MLKDMFLALESANATVAAEQNKMVNFLKALMASPNIMEIQDVDGSILFVNHDMDDIHVREWTTMTSLVIEGINAQGQPIYSETEEGMTNTWDDVPVDFLIQTAQALNELLQAHHIYNAAPTTALKPPLVAEINAAIAKRYPERLNIGQTTDNSLTNKMQCDTFYFDLELPIGAILRYRTCSPNSVGDKPSIVWALHYK